MSTMTPEAFAPEVAGDTLEVAPELLSDLGEAALLDFDVMTADEMPDNIVGAIQAQGGEIPFNSAVK